MTSLRLIGFLRVGLAALEHLEHAVGDQEAADHVDGPEGDGDDEQQLVEEALDGPDQQQAAEHDDAVDGVCAGHQRRVQRVGHLRDDLEAHERRQHQDGDLDDQVHVYAASAAFLAPSWTISPSRVTQAPAMISSSKSSLTLPSSSSMSSSSDCTLRA